MAYLVSNTVPTVTYTGNPHMNRMQDQTEASRLALGGGISVGNNYLLDGFPITDCRTARQPARASRPSRTSRSRCTPTTPRWAGPAAAMFNATAKSGTNRLSGAVFLLMRPGSLIGQNFFLKLQNRAQPNEFWRNAGGGVGGPVVTEQDVLLVRGRRLPGRPVAERQPSRADRRPAQPAISRR